MVITISLIHYFLVNIYFFCKNSTIICLFSHIIKRRKLCVNFIQILSLFIPAARATTAGAGTPFEVWKRRDGEGFRCYACGEDVDLEKKRTHGGEPNPMGTYE